jgi:hypothetical protein
VLPFALPGEWPDWEVRTVCVFLSVTPMLVTFYYKYTAHTRHDTTRHDTTRHTAPPSTQVWWWLVVAGGGGGAGDGGDGAGGWWWLAGVSPWRWVWRWGWFLSIKSVLAHKAKTNQPVGPALKGVATFFIYWAMVALWYYCLHQTTTYRRRRRRNLTWATPYPQVHHQQVPVVGPPPPPANGSRHRVWRNVGTWTWITRPCALAVCVSDCPTNLPLRGWGGASITNVTAASQLTGAARACITSVDSRGSF